MLDAVKHSRARAGNTELGSIRGSLPVFCSNT